MMMPASICDTDANNFCIFSVALSTCVDIFVLSIKTFPGSRVIILY